GNADGLLIQAANSAVRGLVVDDFALYGIEVRDADSATIARNWIGVDPSGRGRAGNYGGVLLLRSNGSHVGNGNVISGNFSGAEVTISSGTFGGTANDNVVAGDAI